MPDRPDHAPAESDAALLRAAARGDVPAFETLYLRHRAFVWRVARCYAGEDAAMDIAQDAFLHLLGRVASLKLAGKLTTFLYPVVKNLALARLRTEGRRAELLRESAARIASESITPSPKSADENDDRALATALAALREEHREVLLMRVVDGMSVEEVGYALGIPVGTVKSRLHHALEKMRGAKA